MPKRHFPDALLAPPKPGEGLKIVPDETVKGLSLRISHAGARVWYLAYRARGTGAQRHLRLGTLDELSPTDARKQAKALWKRILAGDDPHGDKVQRREAAAERREAPDISALAALFIEQHAKAKKRATSVAEDEGLIRQWINPELGKAKVAELTRDDIERLHHKVTKAGTPVRANHVVVLLSTMFSFAVKKGLRADNPAKTIDKNPVAKRQRFLKPDELARLIDALAAYPNQEPANVIRLLLLTGARRGEALGATWDMFDLDAGTWCKPSHLTKQKAEHLIPLSAPARELLVTMRGEADAGDETAQELIREAAKERHAKKKAAKLNAAARARRRKASPYLFPGHADGDQPLNNLVRAWRAICRQAKLDGLRIHDLRHSHASFLASAGLPLPVIGALLGHTQPQTTSRYAHLLLDPLRKATDTLGALYAAHAGKPGGDVVELPKHRKR
jgi:integrase